MTPEYTYVFLPAPVTPEYTHIFLPARESVSTQLYGTHSNRWYPNLYNSLTDETILARTNTICPKPQDEQVRNQHSNSSCFLVYVSQSGYTLGCKVLVSLWVYTLWVYTLWVFVCLFPCGECRQSQRPEVLGYPGARVTGSSELPTLALRSWTWVSPRTEYTLNPSKSPSPANLCVIHTTVWATSLWCSHLLSLRGQILRLIYMTLWTTSHINGHIF